MALTALKSNGQLLTATRAKHLEECTVRISVNGGQSIGTGFFIDPRGIVLTCFHVITPCLKYNAKTKLFEIGSIQIETHDGEKIEYSPLGELSNAADTLSIYDVCILVPKISTSKSTPFLKIGNFSNVADGDEVVTCGYPFGSRNSFMTRGMIGSKTVDTIFQKHTDGSVSKTLRNEALIDITMNKGNSGGAIYKIGDNESQDEVVGIADFIITPVGNDIVALGDSLKASNQSGSYATIMGINPNKAMDMIVTTLANSSDGVSGCISIEYLQHLIAIANKAKH